MIGHNDSVNIFSYCKGTPRLANVSLQRSVDLTMIFEKRILVRSIAETSRRRVCVHSSSATRHYLSEFNGRWPATPERVKIAGDPRANENTLLTAVHTLFVRHHNLLVDRIEASGVNWTRQEIYDAARRIVAGLELCFPSTSVTDDAYLLNLSRFYCYSWSSIVCSHDQ